MVGEERSLVLPWLFFPVLLQQTFCNLEKLITTAKTILTSKQATLPNQENENTANSLKTLQIVYKDSIN